MRPPNDWSLELGTEKKRSSLPDIRELAMLAWRADVQQRLLDQALLLPAAASDSDSKSDKPNAMSLAATCGVFVPPALFALFKTLSQLVADDFDKAGASRRPGSARNFIDKVKSFETRFLDEAVKVASDKRSTLDPSSNPAMSQRELSLIAHDLLRDLADDAARLKNWSECDAQLAEKYEHFFERLGKFHFAYASKNHFAAYASESVKGAEFSNPDITKPRAGVRNTSEKSLGGKVGMGYDMGHSAGASGAVWASIQANKLNNVDLVRDDDDDTLLLKLDSFDIGLLGQVKGSIPGIASGSAGLAVDMKKGHGDFVDGATVQKVYEAEGPQRANRYTFWGHRSSRASVRNFVKTVRRVRQVTGNIAQRNALRPDADHPCSLDDKKIFDYGGCQRSLHAMADGLIGESGSSSAQAFVEKFKTAYPLDDHSVGNEIGVSTVAGLTERNSSREKLGALTATSYSVAADANASLGPGQMLSGSVGAGYTAKSKALDIEKLLDSHEALNPVNAGSLKKSTEMIRSARQTLISARSQHFFCLVDRVVQDFLLYGDPVSDFRELGKSIKRLEAEHEKFLKLQNAFLENPGKPDKLIEMNRLFFDNHFDVHSDFGKPEFAMDFLAKTHDAFSATLGVICNRYANARQKALDELQKIRPGSEPDSAAAKRRIRLDEEAASVDAAYEKLHKKLKAPNTSIPVTRRLRNTFFQLPARLTQKTKTLNATINFVFPAPGLKLAGAPVSDYISYTPPTMKASLSIERGEVANHGNVYRIGEFLSLGCEFETGFPLASLAGKAGDYFVEKLVRAVGDQYGMGMVERESIRSEVRRQLTAQNLAELPVRAIAETTTRKLVFKFRKPMPATAVKSADAFSGKWCNQYMRIEAGSKTSTRYSTGNVVQSTGAPAVLSLAVSSTQAVSVPIKESMGQDVAYNALQFTDGNAWDEKNQTIDFDRLADFYKLGKVHDNKELYKDGKYVAIQMFSSPEHVLDVVKGYDDYKKGRNPHSDYALFDTSDIDRARATYRTGLLAAPGQGGGKTLSELAGLPIDPYDRIVMPDSAAMDALRKKLKDKGEHQSVDVYLTSAEGQKVLTAYFQLMKALNTDKVAYKQSIGYNARVRPNAIVKPEKVGGFRGLFRSIISTP